MQNSHCLLGLVSTTNLQRNLTASIRFRHSGCDWGRRRWFQYHFGRQSHSLVYWDSRNTYTEWPWSRGGIEKYFFFIHYCTMHQTLKWAEEKNNSRMINFGIDFLPYSHRKTYFFALLEQTKPNWGLTRNSEFVEATGSNVELLCLRFVEFTNFATCGFGLDIGFLHGNSQPAPKVVFFPNIGMNVW